VSLGVSLAYWTIGKGLIGALVHTLVDYRVYGRERIPLHGGAVLAMSHFSYVDPAVYGVSCPRRIVFVAKVEAHRTLGVGQLIRSHGTLSVRRGESDREAIRLARAAVRRNQLLGMFVEGTRQRHGEPGPAKPGAAMIAMHEGVPVIPGAVYGSHEWRWGGFQPVSVAWGEPMRFDELRLGSKGYREATAEIESEIRRLWTFLRDLHEIGRPRVATPPRREHVPFKLEA
jgi:1-acyl-sn-glycerol-3-phosphate acyltransferase